MRIAAAFILLALTAASSSQTLVADLWPGPASSDPIVIGEVDGRAVFRAWDGQSTGLYATDGTITTRLGTIDATVQAVPFGGALYFLTSDTDTGMAPFRGDLWRTNGTPASTVRVAELPPHARLGYLAATDNRLFFLLRPAQTAPTELWTSDGSETGTRRVPGAVPRLNDGLRYVVTATRDRILFSADGGETLWASDGTEEGTGLVTTFSPSRQTGSGGFFYGSAVGTGARAFASVVESVESGLHVTDGTAEGTAYIGPYAISLTDLSLTPFGPGLLFATSEGLGGSGPFALRYTDGTAGGTRRVTPDLDLQGSLRFDNVIVHSAEAAFVASDEAEAVALWRIAPDGTSSVAMRLPAGEQLVLRKGWPDVARERRVSQPVAVADGVVYALTFRSAPTPEDDYAGIYTLWRDTPSGAPEVVASYGPIDLNFSPRMTEAAGRVWLTFRTPETGAELFTLGRLAVASEPMPDTPTLALGPPAPNPSAGRVTLALVSEGSVTVEAFDALGRRVAQLHDGPTHGGSVVFDTSRLPAGVYVVRARGVGGQVSQRVVVR